MSRAAGAAVARKPNASEGRDRSTIDENLLLVREMGAQWYDPIPTEQYTCFVDPVFTLTPRGHRMLALLRSYTIRSKGPKGGRTPYAHDGRRALHLKDFAAELGLELAAAYKVWRELEEAGLARTDEKKRLWLTGKVSPASEQPSADEDLPEAPELTEDQQWQKFCTDNFATYLAEQFQRVSKTERRSVHTDVETWDRYEKRAAAEAMDAARKQVQLLRDRHFSERYGIKVRRFERKPDPKAPPRPTPVVQLSLLNPPDVRAPKLSVQNFPEESVQTAKSTSYNAKSGSVQTRPNKEVRVVRESDIYSSSFVAPVRAELRKHGAVDDDVLAGLIDACRQEAPDCTAEEIVHFIAVKATLITKATRNPIGLLKTAVPKCFAPEPFREYRESFLRGNQPQANAGAWGADLTREQLEQEREAQSDPALLRIIDERLRELYNAEEAPREQAQKAGHA